LCTSAGGVVPPHPPPSSPAVVAGQWRYYMPGKHCTKYLVGQPLSGCRATPLPTAAGCCRAMPSADAAPGPAAPQFEAAKAPPSFLLAAPPDALDRIAGCLSLFDRWAGWTRCSQPHTTNRWLGRGAAPCHPHLAGRLTCLYMLINTHWVADKPVDFVGTLRRASCNSPPPGTPSLCCPRRAGAALPPPAALLGPLLPSAAGSRRSGPPPPLTTCRRWLAGCGGTKVCWSVSVLRWLLVWCGWDPGPGPGAGPGPGHRWACQA